MAWRTDLPMSARFTNITKLTECFGDPTAARAGEGELYANASSLDEYEQSCAALVNNEKLNPVRSDANGQSNAGEEAQDPSTPGIKIGEYLNAKPFAEGITSIVYRAQNRPDGAGGNRPIALKVVRSLEEQPPHNPQREARILKKADGPRIIELLDTFRSGFPFVLVFPFMPFDLGSALHNDRLKPVQIQSHLRQLFEALKHLHSLGIIHRDVKPSAILLLSLNGPAYLSDFGISWMPGDRDSEDPAQKLTDVCTTCYRPPELLFGHRAYSTSLDLWAAGCVVAEALLPTHRSLFDPGPLGSELSLIRSIFSQLGTPTEADWPEASNFPDWGKMEFHNYPRRSWPDLLPGVKEEGRDLIERLVRYDSAERRPAVEALAHPYFMHDD